MNSTTDINAYMITLNFSTSTGAVKCGNDSVASGYSITLTNLIGLYEETLSEDEVRVN